MYARNYNRTKWAGPITLSVTLKTFARTEFALLSIERGLPAAESRVAIIPTVSDRQKAGDWMARKG